MIYSLNSLLTVFLCYNYNGDGMIIAHRGVHNNDNIPENSIKAFKTAIDKNYGIEFDIEITKDDKLIIHHDDNLKRMTGLDAYVESLTYDEIKKLKLLNTNETIPSFKELLNLVDGKVFLDIEIKSTKKIDKIVKLVLDELKDYKGELSIKSFNPKIVNKFKKVTDKYKIGLLVMENSKSKLLNRLVKSNIIYKITNFDFLAVHKEMLNNNFYNKYIDNYQIYIWTIDSFEEIEKYNKMYPKVICICNNLI